MNEVQYEAGQEAAELGAHALACLESILDVWEADSLVALGRSVYKHTTCGAWLSVRTWDGRWIHSGDLHTAIKGDVGHLQMGSIIEGSDAEVRADAIDLLKCESPEQAVDLFNRTIEWVEREADAIHDSLFYDSSFSDDA